MTSLTTQYSENYKEQCFQTWYTGGRLSSNKMVELAPLDEYGRKPNKSMFDVWRIDLGWAARADVLDAQVIKKTDDNLIETRVRMLNEQAKRAEALQVKGMEYLHKTGFDSSASAVQAVIRGAELERVSRGLGAALSKLFQMNDEQLADRVKQLLERSAIPSDVVVGEIEEDTEDESQEETDE